MFRHFRGAILMLVWMSVITGGLYPAMVTVAARLIFPEKAGGSLITLDGRIVGSRLIGQPFSDPKYFWSRPSATSPVPYNGGASAGSNLGPTNPELERAIGSRVAALRAADPGQTSPIPMDLLTASGSGLDPDITPAAAYWQVPRVARARGLPEESVRALVLRRTRGRDLYFLGEPRVNVLELNLALDDLRRATP